MSAPVLTVFTDAVPCPRVEVFFSSFDAGTARVTVYRLSGGREFQVRGAVNAVTAGSLSRIDFEVPLNVEVSYRAEQFDAAGVSLGFTPTTTLGDQFTAWVEQARNRAFNPRVVGSTAGWAQITGASPGAATLSAVGANDVPGFVGQSIQVVRSQYSVAPGGGGISAVVLGASAPTRAAVTPDEVLPISLAVRTNVADAHAVFLQWYNGASFVSNQTLTYGPPQAAWSWRLFEEQVVVPSGVTHVVVGVRRQGAPAVSTTIDMAIPMVGATGPFFDGAVASSDPLVRYRFVGSANASDSVRESRVFSGLGVPSAESWMHNPLDPQGSAKVVFGEDGGWSITRPSPGVVSHPKGRRVGVVLSEPRQGIVGLRMIVRTSSDEQADRVQAMFGDDGRPPVVCIRLGLQDQHLRVPQPLFLSTLNVDEIDMNTRWGGTELAHKWDGDEVDPPIPGLFVPLLRAKDINVSFATATAVNAAALRAYDINRMYSLAGAAG